MQNLRTQLRPRRAGGGRAWAIENYVPGDAKVPFVNVTEMGKWVGAILAEPDRYAGTFSAAAAELLTFDEVARILARATGESVGYVQVSDEVFKGFLPEGMREELYGMWVLSRDYGYCGKDMQRLVEWAKVQVDGEVTGLKPWLRREGYKLE